jgi:hypothetical protein
MKLLFTLKHVAYIVYSRYFCRATLVEGIMKDTDLTVRCLFIDKKALSKYMMQRIYSGTPTIVKRWIVFVPSIKKIVRTSSHGIDMCVAVLPLSREKELGNLCDFKAQEWVRQFLPLSSSANVTKERLDRKMRETGRRVRKEGFDCRISNDLHDFDTFYYDMYVPTAQKQFGDLANIEPYEELKSIFLNDGGILIFVMENGSPVAGSLRFLKDKTLVGYRLGVLHGDHDYIKRGAQSAIYYFGIRFARESSCDLVDMLGSRPFLEDGVYRHKREWGAMASHYDTLKTWVFFFILDHGHKTARLFEMNPLIIETKKGLMGLLGVVDAADLSPEKREELIKKYYAPGLRGLVLISPGPSAPIELSFDVRQVKDATAAGLLAGQKSFRLADEETLLKQKACQ